MPVRKNLKYELDMQILIKQSKQQHEAYMKLLNQQDQQKKESETKLQSPQEVEAKASVHESRLLEERIKTLEETVEQLTFENQEMRKKGISAKKEK